jgi:AcrR family transcriptional regulator
VSRKKKASGITRHEILDVAWELISRDGAGISMQDIADAVGVSRQSVYLHFKSRGGLLMELVRHADEKFAIKRHFSKAMAVPEPAKRLDACLIAWFQFAQKIRPVATDLIRLRKTDEDAARAWEDRMRDLRAWERKLVESLAAEAALAGEWSVSDATDYLWSASAIQAYDLLVGDRGWSHAKCARVLRFTIAGALLAQQSGEGRRAP